MNAPITWRPSDELTVRRLDRAGQFCTCHNRHAVALVTGSIDGWYVERYACKATAAWYMNRELVNNAGEPVAVVRIPAGWSPWDVA